MFNFYDLWGTVLIEHVVYNVMTEGAIPRIIKKFECHQGEQGKCLSGHCRNSGKLSGQGMT
jgi:hypothetical protein